MRTFSFSALLLAGLSQAGAPLQAQRAVGYFVEAAGSGGFGSLNIEFRPTERLRLRGGVGLILAYPTMPFTATVALGRGRRAVEVGAGATLMFFPHWDDLGVEFEDRTDLRSVVVPSAVLAYRYESPTGYFFRVGLTPFFPRGHPFFWGGISFGGAF